MKDQLTIGWDEFLEKYPLWLDGEAPSMEITDILNNCKKIKDRWSALDVLNISDLHSAETIWVALHPELMTEMQMHEAACRFAEYALSKVEKTDPRNVDGIKKKRAWLHGEITSAELLSASEVSWNAVIDTEKSVLRITARNAYRAAWLATLNFSVLAAWETAKASVWGATFATTEDRLSQCHMALDDIHKILRDYLMEEYKE